jgi:hypothetical protein
LVSVYTDPFLPFPSSNNHTLIEKLTHSQGMISSFFLGID